MGSPRKALIGHRFGRLTVIGVSPHTDHKHTTFWECLCDCGTRHRSRGAGLQTGKVKSCGCLLRGKHSTHGGSKSPEWKIWLSMRARCNNPNEKAYPFYGGRGIKVCASWETSFAAFLRDVGRRPHASFQLDRIENSGGYQPGNCEWVSRNVNCRHRRDTRWVEYRGETKSLAHWAEVLNLNYKALHRFLKGREFILDDTAVHAFRSTH